MITQHITLSGPGNYFISENFRDFQKNVSINICRRLSYCRTYCVCSVFITRWWGENIAVTKGSKMRRMAVHLVLIEL